MSKPSKLFYVWHSMKKRCELKSYFQYPRYGGRGIKLCEEWHDYQNFKKWAHSSGYGEGLSIDRINNDGDYCPSNCRWATPHQQNRNKSDNRLITYNKVTLPVCDWASIFDIHKNTLCWRLDEGWETRDALFMPTKQGASYERRKANIYDRPPGGE